MAQAADRIVVEVTALVGPYTHAMTQVAVTTSRNMEAAEDAAKKSSEAIGKALETAASRVPGLIKGLAEGQSALQLFLGEASALLPIFGPWGIALGAAAGALGAVLENFDLLTGRVRLSAAELRQLNEQLDQTQPLTEAASEGFDALIRKLDESSEATRRAFIAGLDEELRTQSKGLQEQAADISGAITGMWSDIAVRVVEVLGTGGEAARDFAGHIKDLNDAIDSGDAQPRQYLELADILRNLASGASPALREALETQASELDKAASKTEKLGQTTEILQAKIAAARGDQSELTRTTIDNAAAMDGASGAAGRYAGSIDGVSDSFSRLRAAVAETRAEASPTTGLSFGGQSATFGTKDLRSALVQFVAQSPGSNVPAGFEIPSRPGSGTGGRRTGASAPPQPDADGIPADMLTEAMRLYGDTPLGRYVQAETKIIALKPALISLLRDEEAVQKVLNQALDEAAKAYDKATGESEKAKTQQKELSDAIVAVGDVFKDGIKDAKDFNDALDKIGLSLLELALKGLFGQGALGGVFNQILGNDSGAAGIFSLGSSDDQASGGGGGIGSFLTKAISWLFGGGLAGGGQALPGRLYEVGEAGREWFAPSVPGQVIPNHVIQAAAGGGGSSQPITFNISMAGANGDRAIAEIAAAAVKKGLAGVPEINRQHRIRFA